MWNSYYRIERIESKENLEDLEFGIKNYENRGKKRKDRSARAPLRTDRRGFRLRPDTLHLDYAGQVAGQAGQG
jgi:hypothetical protein